LSLNELRWAVALEPDIDSLASVKPGRNISVEVKNLSSLIELVPSMDIDLGECSNTTKTSNTSDYDSEDSSDDAFDENLNATVRLIHQSAKDYFLDASLPPSLKFGINLERSHSEISRICLTYFCLHGLGHGSSYAQPLEDFTSTADKDIVRNCLKRKLADNPFIEYATLYWPIHARVCCNSTGNNLEKDELNAFIISFLIGCPRRLAAWTQMYKFLRYQRIFSRELTSGLHVAASSFFYEVICTLLDRGLGVNCKDENGYTPLMSLVASSNPATMNDGDITAIARKLIENGANIDEKDPNGVTTLTLASSEDRTGVAELLLEKGAKVNISLYIAAEVGSLRVTERLLDSGADIDGIDADDGITPLVFAIMHGNRRVVELLLHRGARIFNIEYSLNALQVACKYGNLEIVQLFLDLWRETRLGVGLADCNGSNAIGYVVWFGHIEVVRLLLDHGASIQNCGTRVFWELISWARCNAVANGILDTLNLLLSEVQDPQRFGDILHCAAAKNRLDIVNLPSRLWRNGKTHKSKLSSRFQQLC